MFILKNKALILTTICILCVAVSVIMASAIGTHNQQHIGTTDGLVCTEATKTQNESNEKIQMIEYQPPTTYETVPETSFCADIIDDEADEVVSVAGIESIESKDTYETEIEADVVDNNVVQEANEPVAPETEYTDSGNGSYIGTFTMTAYCSCSNCCGSYASNRPLDENGNPIVYTAIGAIAQSNHTIAVDPSVIPYGTEVSINGNTYVAEDCGGGVNGYHIDVYFDNHSEALSFGRQSADVYLAG